VLDECYDVILHGYDWETEYAYLPTGLMEMANWADGLYLPGAVGHVMQDLSGDGVPELLVGTVPDEEAEVVEKGVVFGGYACRDGEVVMFLDGWARNSYEWLGGGRFLNFGSGGAMNSGFGTFGLTKDGTELVCEDFYFTDAKNGTDWEIGYYHNTTGAWDKAVSEELDVTDDDFWAVMEDMIGGYDQLPMTPFSRYAGGVVTVELTENGGSLPSDRDDAAVLFPQVYPAGQERETTLVFRSDGGVKDFKLLAIELKDVDGDGRAVFDKSEVFSLPELRAGVPLTVPMNFPGDIPTTGFSYVDGEGETRQFALNLSGRDGSLVTEPIG
ncbi:MAG: hypothetical protein IK136_05985, partial [Oscillospiraceae bacterium]|nr:hypothetical protein [Oscillospiraceae bacterium]